MIKWGKAYATGIETIDGQHQMLFQMLNDFEIAVDAGGGQHVMNVLLPSLRLYASHHFAHEESCMKARSCPAAEQNVREHAEFLTALEMLNERFQADGFSEELARSLLEFGGRWLTGHICRVDVQLREPLPA